MTEVEIRHNLCTYRYITACECGRTVSLPDSGLAQYDCPCGRVWLSDGEEVSMWTPTAWKCHEMGKD